MGIVVYFLNLMWGQNNCVQMVLIRDAFVSTKWLKLGIDQLSAWVHICILTHVGINVLFNPTAIKGKSIRN